MAEFFGAIQNALGVALNAIYTVIPSYGVAIILLTIAVRAVLIPLTLKQIRSMPAFIALYSILRTSIVVIPLVVTLPGGTPLSADSLPLNNLKGIVCVPHEV